MMKTGMCNGWKYAFYSLYCPRSRDNHFQWDSQAFPLLSHHTLPSSSTDCADRPGGGCGLLPVLAAPPHRPSVGGVWLFPPEPGLLRVQDAGSLLGLQQLLRQPHHLRFPLRELQEFLPAGFLVPGAQQVFQ